MAAKRAVRRASSVRRTTEYYTEGNTVRVREPAAYPYVRESAVRERNRRRAQAIRRRPRQMEAARTSFVSVSFPLTIVLFAAVLATLFMGCKYLGLKSSLDRHMSEIKTLETTLDTLKTENDALERSIDTSVDLNHVYDVAVNQLGMVHVGQDNIIQYDKTESEYVRQYEDIPAGE